MRIVSLLPSATEIVYELGLAESLVGVSCDCDHPPGVEGKPVVSWSALAVDEQARPGDIDRAVRASVSDEQPIYRLDRDLIQELQPDLILAQDLCRVCAVPSGHVTEALESIGCSADVISLDPHTLDGAIAGLEEVGAATGTTARATVVTGELRERVRSVSSVARDLEKVPTVSLEWADPPFSGGHWIPEMIELAGGDDRLGMPAAPSRALTWAGFSAARPSTIVFMPCGYGLSEALEQARRLYEIEAFATTPAAERGSVYAVDSSSYFSRPGPRLVDGLEILAWVLHPESFAPPPPGRVARAPRA